MGKVNMPRFTGRTQGQGRSYKKKSTERHCAFYDAVPLLNLYRSTASSQSFLQSTSAPSLAANKNAPLSFLCQSHQSPSKQLQETHLLRLYVSGGGGVSRCWSMTGICARIRAVMSAHSEPGPKATGWGVPALNGVASSVIDCTCASSISCPSVQRSAREGGERVGETRLVLCAGEVSKLERPRDARVAVVRGGSLEKAHPFVHELRRILARRAKVDELDLCAVVSSRAARQSGGGAPGACVGSTGSWSSSGPSASDGTRRALSSTSLRHTSRSSPLSAHTVEKNSSRSHDCDPPG